MEPSNSRPETRHEGSRDPARSAHLNHTRAGFSLLRMTRGSAPSHHDLFFAVFITNIAEFEFSAHTTARGRFFGGEPVAMRRPAQVPLDRMGFPLTLAGGLQISNAR